MTDTSLPADDASAPADPPAPAGGADAAATVPAEPAVVSSPPAPSTLERLLGIAEKVLEAITKHIEGGL